MKCVYDFEEEAMKRYKDIASNMGDSEKEAFITGVLFATRMRLSESSARSRYPFYMYGLGFMCREAFCWVNDITTTALAQLQEDMQLPRLHPQLFRDDVRRVVSAEGGAAGEPVLNIDRNGLRRAFRRFRTEGHGGLTHLSQFCRLVNAANINYK